MVLIVVVIAINLYWHFYRAWLPKMLREQYGYSRDFVNYFTSVFYIATDIGCIAAGFAVKALSDRGSSVHRARVVTFACCAALTSLGAAIPFVPSAPLMFAMLLLMAAGSLGLFPIYYSLTQELTVRHQGKVIGWLLCIAWLSTALMQSQIGRWVDQTKSYSMALILTAILPLAALLVLATLWNSAQSGKEQSELE